MKDYENLRNVMEGMKKRGKKVKWSILIGQFLLKWKKGLASL
jgi:hypothetical protein